MCFGFSSRPSPSRSHTYYSSHPHPRPRPHPAPKSVPYPYHHHTNPSQGTVMTQWPRFSTEYSYPELAPAPLRPRRATTGTGKNSTYGSQYPPSARVRGRRADQDLDSWHTLRHQPRERIIEVQELNGRWVPEGRLGRYL